MKHYQDWVNNMDNIRTLLSILGAGLTFLVSFLTVIIKLIKNTKAKRKASNLLSLINELIPLIEEAEDFINYTGIEKKAYVETRVEKILNENKNNVSAEDIDNTIESLIDLTKKVNVRRRHVKELNPIKETI